MNHLTKQTIYKLKKIEWLGKNVPEHILVHVLQTQCQRIPERTWHKFAQPPQYTSLIDYAQELVTKLLNILRTHQTKVNKCD